MNLRFFYILRGFILPVSFLFHFHLSLAQVVYNQSDTIRLPEVSLTEVEIVSMRESGRLSRLPLSAAVLDKATIQNQQIKTLKGSAGFLANVFMPDYGSRLTSPVYIRGIGSRINAPSVGLYVDNIPYFEKSVFEFDLLNVERIEVLRGPQGTLYGRNTMGGLINVYSQSPFSQQGTDLSLSGGNPGYVNAGLSHFQPLTGNAAMAVSAGLNRHDGFFMNEFLGSNADAHLSAGGRVRTAWQINSAFTAEFTTHFEHLDQGGYPYAIYDQQSASVLPVNYNRPSSYQRQMSSNGLVFNYNTPFIRLQSVSAFQYFNDKQAIDQDFTVADLVFASQAQNQRMLSQEFTARSQYTGNYQWVIGVFGFNQKVHNDLAIDFGSDAVTLGLVPGQLTRSQVSDIKTSGAAVFHQSSLQHFLISELTLTAGLRLDYEVASLGFNSAMEAAFPTPPPTDFESDLEFYELMPRLALNYEFNPGRSVYAALVRGYKTGGFNIVFESEEERSFDPEFSWNYEFGFKGHFLRERVAVQSSVFYIDWKNQQIYQMLASGQGSLLKNAGASVSKGFELDLKALITRSLQFQGSYGYTHATFVENRLNDQVDHSGNFIPYVPRYTLFAGLRYSHQLNSGFLEALHFQIGYSAVGDHYWNEANSSMQEAFGLLNGMLSLDARNFGIDLFSNNLTSTSYHSFSFAALGRQYVQQGRPATFGLNLRYSF
jgi:iron complex outermembrane recepter protein